MKVKVDLRARSGPIGIPTYPCTSCALILGVPRESKYSMSSCTVSSFGCAVRGSNLCAVHEILVADFPGWGFLRWVKPLTPSM